MLTLGAIVPHSPLLIPNIGKDKRDLLAETLRAYRTIEERMFTAGIETLVIISPHAPAFPDAFAFNLSPTYTGTLAAFGDHETTVRASCDTPLLDGLVAALRASDSPTPLGMDSVPPFALLTSPDLDYGHTIPLLLLTRLLKSFRIIPVSPSALHAKAHANFGAALRETLDNVPTRIAVIASADLSHKRDTRSPTGASVEGAAFDATIRNKVADMDLEALIAMDADAVSAAGQCGYRPILMALGCFYGMNVHATELCYEAPLGVGYMTALIEPA